MARARRAGNTPACLGSCAAGQTQTCTYPTVVCGGGTCLSGEVTPAVSCNNGACPSLSTTLPQQSACNLSGTAC